MMERYGERALIFSMSFRFRPFLNGSQAVPQRHVLRQNAMFKFGLLGLHQSHELPPTCEDLMEFHGSDGSDGPDGPDGSSTLVR